MADIYLTNSLTKKKEKFEPISGKNVNFFVCGPTVYDYSHLGHAKTYVQFDVLARFLRFSGFEVFYLQNITNLDDKILARAKEKGIGWEELTKKYEELYLGDMQKLNNTSVTKYARATDYIEQIVKQVNTLLEKGFAYKIDDGIYFEIAKFSDYGKLSGRTELEQTDAVSRIDENSQKKGWNDFCLWKFSKPDEPTWKASFGDGRPGWHIEDTAISESFFGPQYDIHGGGVDLIIPHHEAEIAQMESASGKKPFVRYWLHTGFLMVDGRKMSKSLHNFFTIEEVFKKGFDPLALRYLFLTAHYRDSINFTWDSLQAAQNSLEKLRNQVATLKIQTKRTTLSQDKDNKRVGYSIDFIKALSDDLNVPQALAVTWEMIKSNIPSSDKYDLAMSFDEVLGLRLDQVEDKKVPTDIQKLLDERQNLRKEGKFDAADKIRDQIISAGYNVGDESLK